MKDSPLFVIFSTRARRLRPTVVLLAVGGLFSWAPVLSLGVTVLSPGASASSLALAYLGSLLLLHLLSVAWGCSSSVVSMLRGRAYEDLSAQMHLPPTGLLDAAVAYFGRTWLRLSLPALALAWGAGLPAQGALGWLGVLLLGSGAIYLHCLLYLSGTASSVLALSLGGGLAIALPMVSWSASQVLPLAGGWLLISWWARQAAGLRLLTPPVRSASRPGGWLTGSGNPLLFRYLRWRRRQLALATLLGALGLSLTYLAPKLGTAYLVTVILGYAAVAVLSHMDFLQEELGNGNYETLLSVVPTSELVDGLAWLGLFPRLVELAIAGLPAGILVSRPWDPGHTGDLPLAVASLILILLAACYMNVSLALDTRRLKSPALLKLLTPGATVWALLCWTAVPIVGLVLAPTMLFIALGLRVQCQGILRRGLPNPGVRVRRLIQEAAARQGAY